MRTNDLLSEFELENIRVENPEGLYQREQYRLSDGLGYLMKRTVSMITTALDQELARYDLTCQQLNILMILSECQCTTAADLGRVTCSDAGAITRMLDRLEGKGIVRRVRSQYDRRVINIELTEPGMLLVKKLPAVPINVMNRYLLGFSKAELETMISQLHRLLSNGGLAIPGDVKNQ